MNRYDRLMEVCQQVIKAMEKTEVPAKDMPELANTLYMLRTVLKSQKLEGRRGRRKLIILSQEYP